MGRVTVQPGDGSPAADAAPGTDAADGTDAAPGTDAFVDSGSGADDAATGTDAVPGTDAATGTDAAFVPSCPPGGPLDCSPGSGTGAANQCFDGVSCFLSDVQGSINDVLSAHPEWFDYNNPTMCPFILDMDGYMNTVVANITARGHCAIRDPNAPNEEVTVKHDNTFSENFDIVVSNGCARYGAGIYTSYCVPAWW